MFAGYLNKGLRGSLTLLVAVYVVAFVIIYLSPHSLEREQYPHLYYNFLTRNISGKFLITTINFLFIAAGVLIINLITLEQDISDKQNYYPHFLFLLLNISSVNPFQINVQIVANVFLLLTVYKLLDTYRRDDVLSDIYSAAFFLSFAAFISVATVFTFPLFFIMLYILRPFYWREWAVAIIGMLIPVFIYECLAYLLDLNRWYLFDSVDMYFRSIEMPSLSVYYLPLIVSLIFMLLLSFMSLLGGSPGNTVKRQRARGIFMWYLLFSSFGFLTAGANSASLILTWSLPLSGFIGDFLFGIRRLAVANILLGLLLMSSLLIFAGKLGLLAI